MSRTTFVNVLGLFGALALSVWLSTLSGEGTPTPRREAAHAGSSLSEARTEDGKRGLRDATGVVVPFADYRRIASASTLADAALFEICGPERVIAYTARSQQNPLTGFHYGGKAALASLTDLETVLTLKPDLLFINHYTNPVYIARLRASGIAVFDLGEMRGLATLRAGLPTVGALVGHPERGELLAERIERRMKTLAATVPTEHRPQALYLSIYGNDVFGGGDDTSYHDVITAAGLRDATIGRFQGYPQLSTEQILNLDPDLVVTKQGMGQVLCSRSGLATLRACHAADGIVELDGNLLDDAGPGMLDAAETLYALIHRAR